MKRILIKNAVIVNEGRKVPGSVVIEGEKIAEILVDRQEAAMPCDETIDASGCYLLPGKPCCGSRRSYLDHGYAEHKSSDHNFGGAE